MIGVIMRDDARYVSGGSTDPLDTLPTKSRSFPSGMLASQVYKEVKGRILTCELHPGTTLTAQHFADEFKVSRTPVHEALKKLAAEGFLDSSPRVGYTVTPLTVHDLKEIYQVRMSLETLAAETAADNFRPQHRKMFERAELEARAKAEELESGHSRDLEVLTAVVSGHRLFHSMIYQIAGNHRLSAHALALHDECQRFWFLKKEYQQQTNFMSDPAHRKIYDAIAAGDKRAARHATGDHLRDGLTEILATALPAFPHYGESESSSLKPLD